jgi:hypothetical protein
MRVVWFRRGMDWAVEKKGDTDFRILGKGGWWSRQCQARGIRFLVYADALAPCQALTLRSHYLLPAISLRFFKQPRKGLERLRAGEDAPVKVETGA